jgi:hypothetical protein
MQKRAEMNIYSKDFENLKSAGIRDLRIGNADWVPWIGDGDQGSNILGI